MARAVLGTVPLTIDVGASERESRLAIVRDCPRDTPFHRYPDGDGARPDGAALLAMPPLIEGLGTFPVRAFAVES